MDGSHHYDCIVVGSGPGGATVARELAETIARVLIIESGPRLNKTGFFNIAPRAFLDRDRTATVSDGGVWFGNPRLLGGASYVAMGNAADPPPKILDEWNMDLSRELAWARKSLRVNPMPEELMGEGTRRINQGADSLGLKMTPTPKCVDFSKCIGCGLCMFGCPTGAKWTTLEFIDHAQKNGADVLTETHAVKVIHRDGRVGGVEAIRKGRLERFFAPLVILASGALSTPLILGNSGIPAGTGLAGDVFQTTYGYHPETGMKGEIILGSYLESVIEDRELFPAPYMYIPFLVYKDKIGGFPAKISLAQQAKYLMLSKSIDTRHLLGMMTKIRDERTGKVNGDGSIEKKLTEKDMAKLREAHQLNREILIASGVEEPSVFTGVYESGHPCCTAAIGEVVDDNQETEISGLFVSDASVFPSPLGMPPILTLVALSKQLADRITGDAAVPGE
jgi:choline dehydrogenase-like flavoprotein